MSLECAQRELAGILMAGRHCDADEEHDPASDFEEALECLVCGAFGRFPRHTQRAVVGGWGVDK